MVFSTDVANHFKNLEVLKTVTPKQFLDEKDSVVYHLIFSLLLSNFSMHVILEILVLISIIISVGELWLVFSLTKLPGRRKSWVLRLQNSWNTIIWRNFTETRQVFVRVWCFLFGRSCIQFCRGLSRWWAT